MFFFNRYTRSSIFAAVESTSTRKSERDRSESLTEVERSVSLCLRPSSILSSNTLGTVVLARARVRPRSQPINIIERRHRSSAGRGVKSTTGDGDALYIFHFIFSFLTNIIETQSRLMGEREDPSADFRTVRHTRSRLGF